MTVRSTLEREDLPKNSIKDVNVIQMHAVVHIFVPTFSHPEVTD